MAALGYIRVSTDKQLVDRQLQQLEEHCDQVFVERGVSAVAKRRPVYNELIATLQEGDIFVVSSLDRAFRSVIDALNELEQLKNRNIQFKSLSQDFDTATPEGKLLYTVMAALAEWERNILSKRTKEGLAAAKKRGKIPGRPRKLSDHDIEIATNLLDDDVPLVVTAKLFNVHQSTLKRAVEG